VVRRTCIVITAGTNRQALRAWAAACLIFVATPVAAQELEAQKSAVVKLISQQDGKTRVGTGFIVKREPDSIYIATASHVVEGDQAPSVEFFTARNRRVQAEVLRLEGGDPKGIALLAVRGKDKLPPRGNALPFDLNAELEGGEEVTTIGFGRGQGDWAVLRAQVISVDGRDLKLDGRIEEGNSGGPVLRDGKVVGLITSQKGIGLATPVQFVSFVLKSWGMDVSQTGSTAKPQAPAAATEPAPASRASTPGSQGQSERRAEQPAATATAPAADSAGRPLAWQDHALRFEGAVRDDLAVPVLQAQIFDLRTGVQLGTFDAPIGADLSQAPALIILSATFNIPGDSITAQPHAHSSNLHFEVRSDNQAALVRNCDPLGCYPASGVLPLE